MFGISSNACHVVPSPTYGILNLNRILWPRDPTSGNQRKLKILSIIIGEANQSSLSISKVVGWIASILLFGRQCFGTGPQLTFWIGLESRAELSLVWTISTWWLWTVMQSPFKIKSLKCSKNRIAGKVDSHLESKFRRRWIVRNESIGHWPTNCRSIYLDIQLRQGILFGCVHSPRVVFND